MRKSPILVECNYRPKCVIGGKRKHLACMRRSSSRRQDSAESLARSEMIPGSIWRKSLQIACSSWIITRPAGSQVRFISMIGCPDKPTEAAGRSHIPILRATLFSLHPVDPLLIRTHTTSCYHQLLPPGLCCHIEPSQLLSQLLSAVELPPQEIHSQPLSHPRVSGRHC